MMKIAFVLVILCGVYPALSSQDESIRYGSLRGEVFDGTTKEPLAGVTIAVVGTTLGSSSDTLGQFTISQIPPGTYAVRASAIGYTPYIATDVVVTIARPAEIRIPLEESAVQLDVVRVSPSYFQKNPDRPISSLIQSNEEIRRLPGGLEDVIRAVSIVPGVAQVQPGRNDLIVRGGAPSENLFCVDNIEVPNINHFGTQGSGGGPLSLINLDFVDQTSFSTGGFGVRYGDKLSSILSISIGEGRKDRIGGKATISASQFGLNLEGPVSDDGTFLFSARRSYLDFIFKAAGFGFVPEYWDFLGKAVYHLSPHDRLEVLGIGALDGVKLFNTTQDQRFDNSRVLGSDQNQFIGGITWRHLMNRGFFTVTAGQSYVEYRYLQNDSMLIQLFRTSSYEHESSLRTDLLTHIANGTEVSVGAQIKNIRFSDDIALAPQVTSFGDSIGLNAAYRTGATKASASIQISQDISDLRLTAGGRLDYFDLIRDNVVFSPRIAATYALSALVSLNASVGRYYQSPSYIWLVANPINTNLSYIGANQYIVGVDYVLLADTRLSIETYLKTYFDYPASLSRNYLVLANTGAGFGGSQEGFAAFGLDPLLSAGKGRSRGIEFLAQKKLSDIPCYGTLSVSYNKAEFAAVDGITRPGSFDQRWIINVGGGYVLDARWEFSAKFRYVTGRPYTPYDQTGIQSGVLYNTLRISPNHSLDVRVDRRWSLMDWSLNTYIDIQNVYNRKPIDVPVYNIRTGQVEQTSSIGILPSIGVSVIF